MNAFRIRPLLGIAAVILLVAGVVAEPVQAQQGTVAGQITDKSNQQPVPGAAVIISGTSLQGRTSREGRYTITNVPAGRYSVQVRLIGYATATQPVTVAAGETATADFALTAAAVPLDAVVVSATGQEQLKRELGNNVGTIDAAKVAQQVLPTNAADLLNSRVPGVEVMQSGGTTGTGSRVRIRGSTSLSLRNEPIATVDGVRVDNTANADGNLGVGGQAPSRLNDFNPDDFEAVEVVKGPSAAALYGTDAANGVIQFRTKQGRPGPTKWTAYAEGGTLNDRADWPANFFSRRASGTSCRLTSQAAGACTIVGVDSFNPLKQNSPFRQGVRQHYGLSASGGTEVTTFYVSGDFQREKGIYESNDLKKTSLRANIRNQVSRLMDLTATVGYVTSNLALPQNDNNDQGIASSGLLGFPWDTIAPTGNPANPSLPAIKGGYRFLTPTQANLISTTQRVERFTGGLNVNFRPASFLAMRGTAGYDITNQGDNELTPPNVIPLDQSRLDGNAFQYRAQIFSYTANFATTASFRLSPIITSNTTVGVQYYKNVYQQTQASGRKVVAGTTALGGVVVPTVGDTTAPAVTLGGYVQEEVGLRDRLYITGALRADKHSAFGTNFSDIIYPKLSGSWVISEEPFFPHPSWLGSLRLRAAWGKSGRAPGVLDALQFFRPVAVAVNGTDAPGITIGGAGNANLKPEQTREIEAGFDADLINQRVHLEATYYNKNSKDALVAVPVAPSLGVSFTRFDNLGEVSNKGVELLVTAQLVSTPNVIWSVTASGWGNKNRVLSTGPGNTPIIFGLGGSTQRHQVGFPAGGYWGTSYTFQDLNGDGIINPATEMTFAASDTFQGSSVPTRGATFSTDVTLLGHFTLHGLLDGRWGNKLDNSTESFRCLFGICAGIRVPGIPLADQAAAQAALAGLETGYFQDAGFLKLREVSVTYTAPGEWASRIGASALSLTVSGRNLVTWTNYRGVDPEINDAGQFNFSVADFLTQPPVRQFVARMNVTF
ncbi:MAG TPA: SusC/RagA family TonB-linked outer membrane protein [Gemmatimonadales bacterium]